MHRKGKMMRKVRLGTEINDAPSSSQRPGLAGPGRCRDSPSEVRAWVWSEAGLGSPPPPSPSCVNLQLLCVPGPQFLHVERGVVGAPTSAGREDCAARCSSLSITASGGLHTTPAETRADVGVGCSPCGPRGYGLRGPVLTDPSTMPLWSLAPGVWAGAGAHHTGRSLTWSNTWLLVALYFCAMASATAFGPMNSVFQLWELRGGTGRSDCG